MFTRIYIYMSLIDIVYFYTIYINVLIKNMYDDIPVFFLTLYRCMEKLYMAFIHIVIYIYICIHRVWAANRCFWKHFPPEHR